MTSRDPSILGMTKHRLHNNLNVSCHRLVTSDLAFFVESLRSLHGMKDIGKVLDDVWKTVNELRSAKNSPATGRKASLQK